MGGIHIIIMKNFSYHSPEALFSGIFCIVAHTKTATVVHANDITVCTIENYVCDGQFSHILLLNYIFLHLRGLGI